jgi:hypothetical protein
MMQKTRNTTEEMIFEMWRDCVDGVAEYSSVPIETVQRLIAQTRKVASDAGWPPVYTHNFFVELRKQLARGTLGHPTTAQIIRLLEIETEFD